MNLPAMRKLMALTLVFIMAGCTGGNNITQEQAVDIALEQASVNHPNVFPKVMDSTDYGKAWKVDVEAGNVSPSYLVDKDTGIVSITSDYALAIVMADPYVKNLSEKYSPLNPYFEHNGIDWNIRFVQNQEEILAVTVGSEEEKVLQLNKKVLDMSLDMTQTG